MAGSAPIRIGVAGAMGRMGHAIVAAAATRPDLAIGALFDRPGSEGEAIGQARLVSRDAAFETCDVIVDFTNGPASEALAKAAAARGGPALVIGSTGLTEAEEDAVRAASARIAIVRTGNFSLGVNLLAGIVRQVARQLGPEDWDVEVVEAHHRRKVDAPSGTALMLGQAAAEGRGVGLGQVAVRGREGIPGARRAGDIGFAVLRGGGIVGEHQVMFAAEDEIITFSHSARDRSLFARGAVAAAAWVAGKPPGLYDMQNVLGFRD